MTEDSTEAVETNDELQAADSGTASGGNEGADSLGSTGDSGQVAQPQAEEAPSNPPPSNAGGNAGAQSEVRRSSPGIDLNAELNAKEILADKLEAGLIGIEEYAKAVAKHDKAITQGQRELAKPAQQVQQVYEQQAAAASYWTNWGKGKDVAQLQFGKTVKADKAAQLFKQARAEVYANPRYQGRSEIDAESIAYDRWMDKMEAEAKKTPAQQQRTSTPQTRVSGDGPVTQTGGDGRRRTAREKLEAGEYNLT